jgi:hypothetical protein
MGLVMIPVILLAALIGSIFGNIPLWKYARKQHRKFSEAAGKEPRWGLFYLSMIPAACLVLAIFLTPFVFFVQGTAGAGAPTGDSLITIVLSFFVFGLAPGFGLILAAFLWKFLRSIGVPDWVTGTAVVIAIFAVLYAMFSRLYIGALLIDADLADQLWELWDVGLISDELAGMLWAAIPTAAIPIS